MEINNKNEWEEFLLAVEEKTFLQSWNWGEFQKSLGEKVWRLGIYDNDLAGVAQAIKIRARRGRFLLVPHGPVISNFPASPAGGQFSIFKQLVKKLKEIAKQEKCAFIRVAPIWECSAENEKLFKDLGFSPAPIHIHPQLTWELGLEKNSDEILSQMRKTTRYLIKQGLKDPDLKIEKSANVNDIEVFNRLYQKTVSRQGFTPFSLDYLKKELAAFADCPSTPAQGAGAASVFLAKYREECLAAAIIIFWQGIAFYHQGASINSKIPAAYLLQWEIIKEAKARGCRLYNFWGIAPLSEPKHPWAGLSLFKTGFGGYGKAYVKTQDLPISPRYWLTFIFEKLRNIKRGF